MSGPIVSAEFLLWAELCALWSVSAYLVSADPLPGDRANPNFSWSGWRNALAVRIAATAILCYWMSRSIVLSAWLAAVVALHPWIRFRSPLKWTAEIEATVLVSNALFVFAIVRRFSLQPHLHVPVPLSVEQLSALSILLATLSFVVRGGTYIVRGFLRKTGTLPRLSPAGVPSAKSDTHAPPIHASATREKVPPPQKRLQKLRIRPFLRRRSPSPPPNSSTSSKSIAAA